MGKDISGIPKARKICGERLPMKSKKEPPSSPFSQLSFIHYFFTALLVYYHENSLHYHGNPYIITKTHRQFPCLYMGFACEYRLLPDSMEFCLIVSEFP